MFLFKKKSLKNYLFDLSKKYLFILELDVNYSDSPAFDGRVIVLRLRY